MADRPELSVVMGVYNGARSLAGTMDSVLSQGGVELEVIAVDDGSADETAAILRRYASRDARVRVISQANAGLTHALIAGCNAARSDLIARHDCGDRSLPSRLAKQLALLRSNPSIGFVSCWTEVHGPGGEPLGVQSGGLVHSNPVRILETFGKRGVTMGPSWHPTAMFRRDLYFACGGYRSSFRYGQDWDLWYRMAERAEFAMVPEVLYVAELGLDCISLNRKREQTAFSTLSREAVLTRRKGLSDSKILERAAALSLQMSSRRGMPNRAAAHYFIGESLRRRGDPRAMEYLVHAWRAAPWNAKSLLRLLQLAFGRRGKV